MQIEMPFEFESILTGLAAIAAWVAALVAYRSYRVSKKALELSELESNAKKSNIAVYLADSFRIYDRKRKQGKYIFSIAYSNKSDSDDAITEVDLETFYITSGNRVNHLICSHEQDTSEWLSGDAKPAKLPLNIQARSSVTSWFVFGTLSITEKAQRIEKYRVVARNGKGQEVAVESFILREIEYAKSS